jgi:hypothetical protein
LVPNGHDASTTLREIRHRPSAPHDGSFDRTVGADEQDAGLVRVLDERVTQRELGSPDGIFRVDRDVAGIVNPEVVEAEALGTRRNQPEPRASDSDAMNFRPIRTARNRECGDRRAGAGDLDQGGAPPPELHRRVLDHHVLGVAAGRNRKRRSRHRGVDRLLYRRPRLRLRSIAIASRIGPIDEHRGRVDEDITPFAVGTGRHLVALPFAWQRGEAGKTGHRRKDGRASTISVGLEAVAARIRWNAGRAATALLERYLARGASAILHPGFEAAAALELERSGSASGLAARVDLGRLGVLVGTVVMTTRDDRERDDSR